MVRAARRKVAVTPACPVPPDRLLKTLIEPMYW